MLTIFINFKKFIKFIDNYLMLFKKEQLWDSNPQTYQIACAIQVGIEPT
jgi:hypothetical protein